MFLGEIRLPIQRDLAAFRPFKRLQEHKCRAVCLLLAISMKTAPRIAPLSSIQALSGKGSVLCCGATHIESSLLWWQVRQIWKQISVPSQLPFITNFCTGNGKGVFLEGRKVSEKPWFCLSMQDILPHGDFSKALFSSCRLKSGIALQTTMMRASMEVTVCCSRMTGIAALSLFRCSMSTSTSLSTLRCHLLRCFLQHVLT